MSRINTHLILLTGAVLTLLASCTQNDVFQGAAGDGVLTARIEGTVTKTSYDSIEGKFAWTAGDEIALHYTTGGYTTYSVNPTDGSVNASATATNYRDYFAVYPATAAVASNYGNPTLQITLPNSYDITDIVAGDKTADFSPVPMVAINDINNSILDFYHVGGLLRITCSGLAEDTQKVTVTFDKKVTGTYNVVYGIDPLDGSQKPTISTSNSASNNVVSFILAAEGTSIGEMTDPIILNVPVPCGTYNSVTVKGYDTENNEIISREFNSAPLVFARHHGKKIDVGELTFNFFIGNYNGTSIVNLSNVTSQYYGMNGELAESFVSYKTDGVNPPEPVPFILEYSEDDGNTWSSTAPEWLEPLAASFDGSTPLSPQQLQLSVKAQRNHIEDVHHTDLAQRPVLTDFDLSKYNVATGETLDNSTTANCYVIQNAGTFRFPVVYGNAIKDGAVNEPGYVKQYFGTGQGGLDRFLDHLDNPINSPYIAVQHSDKEMSAHVVALDSPNLVADVEYNDNGTPDDGSDDFISFSVPQDYITQGNALIAVFADDRIAWSWHIWVTDTNMIGGKEFVDGKFLSPEPLGWVDKVFKAYEGRTCKVRAIQPSSNAVSNVVSVVQSGYQATITWHSASYAHGRKDPYFPYGDWTYPSNLVLRYTNAAGEGRTSATLGASIMDPTSLTANHLADGNPYQNLWNTNYKANTVAEDRIKTIYDPSPVGYAIVLNSTLKSSRTSTRWIPYVQADEYKMFGWYYDVNNDGIGTDEDDIFFPLLGSRNSNNGAWINYNDAVVWNALMDTGYGGASNRGTVYGMNTTTPMYEGYYVRRTSALPSFCVVE